MIIFIYNNIIGNMCSGDYYFVANSGKDAHIMASKFADSHNELAKNNPNYIIEWDNENVIEHEIGLGFLPLNRSLLFMEK